MKKSSNPLYFPGIWLLLPGIFFLVACGPTTLDTAIFGTWESAPHKVTVRTKPEGMGFRFFSDTVTTLLVISPDKTVSGKIGEATIEEGKIGTNWLLPSRMTGVACTIKARLEGKIFDSDPLDTKEVQFWIGPEFKQDDWELRYTTGGAQFPMAAIYMTKTEEEPASDPSLR